MAGKPGIQQAGDVIVKGITLIDTKNGNKSYDLLGSFTDLRITESVHSAKLYGYIALTESQNWIESIPITGHEVIHIELQTPGLSPIKCAFVVVSVGMKMQQDKHSAYSLNLISREAYLTLNKRISKVYHGNASELAAKVFFDNFGNEMLDIDTSDNVIKFISPYWDPMTVINHIARHALYPNAKIKTPNYLFYETTRGHKFKSLSTLYNQPNYTTFVSDKHPGRIVSEDGTSSRDISREYGNALSLTFVEAPCVVRDTLTGVLNTNVVGLDIFRKKINISSYNAATDFNKLSHTDSDPLIPLIAHGTAGLYMVKHTYPNLFDGVDDVSDDIYAKTAANLGQLNEYKINMVVHGRTDLEAGMMVFVIMNKFASIDMSDVHSAEAYDKMYTGRYLITRIEHAFSQTKHQSTLELIKDSVSKGTW